jgi:hypothetical protein
LILLALNWHGRHRSVNADANASVLMHGVAVIGAGMRDSPPHNDAMATLVAVRGIK